MTSGQGSWTRLSLEDIARLESQSLRKKDVIKENLKTAPIFEGGNSFSATDLIRAKQLKVNELKRVGSENILKIVNRSLASGVIDPRFFCEQVHLSNWRYVMLRSNFGMNDEEDLGYLMTQRFYEAIQSIRSPEVPPPRLEGRYTAPSIKTNKSLGWKAAQRYVLPYVTYIYLGRLHLDLKDIKSKLSCKKPCLSCRKLVNKITTHIINFPLSIILTARMIRTFPGNSVAPRSLKEMCMRRVVELEQDQACLPLSLREDLKKGPEDRKLKPKPDKMLRILAGMFMAKSKLKAIPGAGNKIWL